MYVCMYVQDVHVYLRALCVCVNYVVKYIDIYIYMHTPFASMQKISGNLLFTQG